MAEVSIIIPTKNNGDILEKCLQSIESLDYPKKDCEVIIVDGHSIDDTVKVATRYGYKVVYENVGTIGGARNIGVENSTGKYIVFTDADCVVQPDWLKEMMIHLKKAKVASVGGPNITPDDDTEFARFVGDVLSFLSRVGPRYGFYSGEVKEIYHNPTCNSAYRKEVFQEVGGFNPKLITCDDEELDYRIRKKGYKILFTPKAKVLHYRRPTWKRFWKMAYSYGVGRMQAIKLHQDMGRWFHYAPSALIVLILLLLLLFVLSYLFPLIALGILVGGAFGIAAISLYFSRGKVKDSLRYFGLVTTWFFGYGFGMIRGLSK
jgi:GT2 family glycosyltransferase